MHLKSSLKKYRDRVESAFNDLLPAENLRPARLHKAIHYSLKAGGKRIRPVLLMAAFDLFPSKRDPIPAAVAVECLHTYTLIHDDLPAIDNSDLRRGRPTCHQQFDESTALLAGDALLTHAFRILAEYYSAQPEIATVLIFDLSDAAGSTKLIGGQIEDITCKSEDYKPEDIEFIYRNKTTVLFTASLRMGVRLSAADASILEHVKTVGDNLGFAFQIIDDILDVTADPATLGKPTDQDNAKVNYVSLYGVERSRQKAKMHTQKAVEACYAIGGNNTFLIDLIRYMEHRIY